MGDPLDIVAERLRADAQDRGRKNIEIEKTEENDHI